MLYENPPFGSIIFTPRTIETFKKYQQQSPEDKEAGGYLFGELQKEQLVIKIASEPNIGDIRRRTFFKRNAARGQKFLNWLWRKSNRRLVLVGEWHSHPEPQPKPSVTDLSESQKSFHENEFPLGFMVVVIIGNNSIVDAWVGVQSQDRISQIFRSGHILWQDKIISSL